MGIPGVIVETPAQERERRSIPREQWNAERAAAKRRNAEARKRTHAKVRERKQKEQYKPLPAVTWLPKPVPVKPGSQTLVVGVCADAAPDVRAAYGVS